MLGFQKIGHGARAVVVLHEWLGGHLNWKPIWPFLNTSEFTFIFADLRGYGLSGHVEGVYTLAEAVQDVALLADHLGYERFELVGHSMSG